MTIRTSDWFFPSTDVVREAYRATFELAPGIGAEFDRWLANHDAATRTAALEELEGIEYGRRKRESGEVFALRGPPRPDWWGESQEDYEHVQRLVGRWIPATAADLDAIRGRYNEIKGTA